MSNSIDDSGNGVFGMNSDVRFADIEDGTEFTFLVGERSMTRKSEFGAIWMRSVNRYGNQGDGTSVAGICRRDLLLNDATQGNGFLSWHPRGVQFAMVDGSIHFISEGIDGKTYESLAQIRDGSRLTASDLAAATQKP